MEAAVTPLTTIFSKRPLPGLVKTRLCPPLTFEQAATFALAMLDDTVDRELRDRPYAVHLAIAPTASLEWFQGRFGERVPVSAQVGEGLGERMAQWFNLKCGERPSVVIVGADSPLLDRDTVVLAHAQLARGVDLVVAPDGGGGYSMVGLARPVPELFTRIPMSTRSMLDETLELAHSLGLSTEILAVHRDVDDGDDLRRIHRELRQLTIGGRESGLADFPARTFDWLCRTLGDQDEH